MMKFLVGIFYSTVYALAKSKEVKELLFIMHYSKLSEHVGKRVTHHLMLRKYNIFLYNSI